MVLVRNDDDLLIGDLIHQPVLVIDAARPISLEVAVLHEMREMHDSEQLRVGQTFADELAAPLTSLQVDIFAIAGEMRGVRKELPTHSTEKPFGAQVAPDGATRILDVAYLQTGRS